MFGGKVLSKACRVKVNHMLKKNLQKENCWWNIMIVRRRNEIIIMAMYSTNHALNTWCPCQNVRMSDVCMYVWFIKKSFQQKIIQLVPVTHIILVIMIICKKNNLVQREKSSIFARVPRPKNILTVTFITIKYQKFKKHMSEMCCDFCSSWETRGR